MDKERFERLYRDYLPELILNAMKIIKDEQEARDLVIDIFCDVWKKGRDFKEDAEFLNFMYTSVRNRCLNKIAHFRHVKKHARYTIINEDYFDESWEMKFLDKDIASRIQKKMHVLPPKCRHVFTLSYLEGVETREICEMLNLKPSSVYTQKQRAISLLKGAINLS
jgi:RNA polymerase sigma-70 factor (ECF subfamily)